MYARVPHQVARCNECKSKEEECEEGKTDSSEGTTRSKLLLCQRIEAQTKEGRELEEGERKGEEDIESRQRQQDHHA